MIYEAKTVKDDALIWNAEAGVQTNAAKTRSDEAIALNDEVAPLIVGARC